MSNKMMRLSDEDFTRGPHAVKYGDQLQEHRSAFERLFLLLNDPANEQRLIDAESFDKPALWKHLQQRGASQGACSDMLLVLDSAAPPAMGN